MAAAPSDGGGSDADTGWLSDDTGPEAEDEGDRRESSGAASSSGVERRPPQRPPDEDEPTLEYRLLGAGVSSLLEEDVASCAAAREDLFALGTKSGRVHVFSHAGDFCSRARRLSSASPLDRAPTHAAPVTGVAFDARGEHVASCAADGTVSVARLGRRRRPARERSAADAGRGVSVVFAGEHDCAALAVALDPRETDAARRCVVVGLADGRLVVRTFASEPPGARGARDESSGDFGDCSSVRDSAKTIFEGRGEGPVRAVAWAGPCVAWANDRGVKIYDIAAQTPVAFIERPRGSPPPERYPPRLVWDGDATLLAGWADCVWVIAVSPRRDSAARRAEVLEQFQTEYVVAGIAPHGEDELAILAFLETPERDERGAASEKETTSTNQRVPPASRPEMRVVRRRSAGAAETSRDALGVDGYAAFRPEEYALVSPSRERGFGGATDARSESASPPRLAYLLASPKALVAARARTRAERIAWLSSRNDFDAALELCDEDERFGGGDDAKTSKTSKTSRDAVVTAYVEHLLRECGGVGNADADVDAKREALCRLCPRLFRGDAALWEKWLFRFARGASEREARAMLATIAPYVPTANPALRPEAYELILHAFLAFPEDHARFLATVKAWPGSLYGVAGMVSAARRAVFALSRESAGKDAETPNAIATLREALAELYLLDGQRERALAAHLALGRPSVLDFVARHDLLSLVAADGDALRRAVAPLALLDPHKAAALFVDRRDVAPPELVAAHLARAAAETTGADDDLLDFREASESESRRTQTERSAARGGDLGARETYHLYLRRLFATDKAACPTHRDAQTALFAEFHPEELGAFLRDASSALDLHEALRVVERFEAEARETASDLEGVETASGFSETASAENAEDVAEDDAEDDRKNKNESESSAHWRRRQRLFASERASLLSRLGATRAALRVLVDAGDIARAVALTHERAAPDPRDALDEGDDELWDELIELVTERAKGEMVGKKVQDVVESGGGSDAIRSGDPFVSDSGNDSRASRSHLLAEGRGIGELLDVAGAVVDPSRVLARVPTGAAIDGLRARLVRVLAERRANARRARLARDVSARFLAKARRERLDAGRRAFPPARVVAED
jgi:hypothetical protein